MNLKPGSHIHMMGICGTAMASLAGLLKDRGFHVTGSDANPYPPMSTQIENLKIPLFKGYKKENLSPKPDFVIIGNVISANNEEAQEVIRLEVPYTSLAKAMGELIIADRDSYVISGTHGKTTTTSLMSFVADQCGQKPGFLIGGIPKNFSQSFRNPEGNIFVIEGDEYDTAYFDKVPKFIHYKPKNVILTSIEFDHADIYKDLDAVKNAFKMLLKLIPADGTLLTHVNDQNIKSILTEAKCRNSFTYGLDSGDFKAQIVSKPNEETRFKVAFKDKEIGTFTISLSGGYNVLNATAVIAMAYLQKWNMEQVKKALHNFQGVKRRQEIIGEPNGITIIEDFAHHPTAVKETVQAIQNKYSGRRVFSVFEPRSATSRRKVFQKDYVEAFKIANEIIIAKAFDQSKIDAENRFSSEDLVSELHKNGKSAVCLENADAIVADLKKRSHRGDVILIMSNGGFDGIYQKLLSSLG